MNVPTDAERGALALDEILSGRNKKLSKSLPAATNILTGPASGLPEQLQVTTLHDFMEREIVPRKTLLSPWLMTQSLNMIYGWRGIGKTHVSLGICYAVASGGNFLNWRAEQPRRVLLLDGEMPAAALQERLARIVASNPLCPEDGFFSIVTPDLQTGVMPDLSTYDGQEAINAAVEACGAELIVVDNLSCLVRGSARENEAESWNSVSEWGLQQRKLGRSVLFIHHAGKGGQQRGTSKREDLLDTVISLRHPSDYQPVSGACFEIHFEKARHLLGDDIAPIEAIYTTDNNGLAVWTYRSVEETTAARVIDLAQ